MLKLSVHNKIYTLNNIQRKVDIYNSVKSYDKKK